MNQTRLHFTSSKMNRFAQERQTIRSLLGSMVQQLRKIMDEQRELDQKSVEAQFFRTDKDSL